MMRMKLVFIVLCCFLCSVPASRLGKIGDIADNSKAINVSDAEVGGGSKKPTDGEIGILATLAGVYGKTRDAVKTVYDEIQYWRGIAATYQMTKDWFNDQKERFKQIGRTVGTFFSEPGDIFAKLDQAESLFNQTDNLIFGAPQELDKIFGHLEVHIDQLADSKLSGALIPSTDEVFESFNLMIYNSDMSEDQKRKVLGSSFYPDEEEELINYQNELYEDINADMMPETEIMNVIKGMSASAVENSTMYTQWAIKSATTLSHKIQEVDAAFADGKMENIMDVQILAAMTDMEMINANNKRILHNLEVLKVHNAMLGLEIWVQNAEDIQDEALVATFLSYRDDVISESDIVLDNIKKYGTVGKL